MIAIGLHRVRVGIVVAMMAIVSLAAGSIFDRWVWWLALAPVLVGATGIATIDRRWPLRMAGAVAATIAATAGIVIATAGSVADVVVPFGSGTRRLLSTDWPSPDSADLIGTVALLLAASSAFGVELARRTRLHLAPLLPVTVAAIGVIALSAADGVAVAWLLPLAVLAMALAALRPDTGVELRERIMLLRGERRLLPLSMVAIGAAAAVAVPIAFTDRADPRRDDPPERSAPLLDPIEATLALQAIDPPIALHVVSISAIESAASDRPLTRWRTAALSVFDGRRWQPDLSLRPIGRRLGPDADDTVDATVSFLADDLQLVPMPGPPVVVDARIQTDADRTIVRLTDRPSPGDVVTLSARVTPPLVDATGPVGTRQVDETASSLSDLADGLAEAGGADASTDLRGRLQAIESTMRNDFILRSDAPGGGLQRVLIERFLRDTRQGNGEQFATGFVLLARSLGVDARVATGFDIDSVAIDPVTGTAEIVISSDDAAVWPEVLIGDDWIAFDPAPAEEASDATPPPEEPQVQSPAAPQPPIPPAPDSADEPVITDDTTDATAATGLPRVVTAALWTIAGLSLLIVPIAMVVAVILSLKWRRRRRRLSGTPAERIVGAWSIATSRLVDGGLRIAQSETNDEIAAAAGPFVPNAHREVHRLATLASATTFGDPARPDLLAQDAAACLMQVEAEMAAARTPVQRLRWRLSLRSLRRRTASPV